jgi:hypothetical protein
MTVLRERHSHSFYVVDVDKILDVGQRHSFSHVHEFVASEYHEHRVGRKTYSMRHFSFRQTANSEAVQ